jgi:hypothetical protein
MRIDREEPAEDGRGWVVCRVCGRRWDTTPEQDDLLARLFAHDAGHVLRVTGPGPP